MRCLLWCLLAGTLSSLPQADLLAQQRTPHAVWIDPIDFDLADNRLVADLLDIPVRRYVVSAVVRGQAVFPSSSDVLRQMPQYKDKPNALASFVRQARSRDKQVYALVDCLHWTAPGTPPEWDVLERRPSLAERDLQGDVGYRPRGSTPRPFTRRSGDPYKQSSASSRLATRT